MSLPLVAPRTITGPGSESVAGPIPTHPARGAGRLVRHLALTIIAFVLLASACGSTSESSSDTDTDDAATEQAATSLTSDDPSPSSGDEIDADQSDSVATSDPVPTDDGAAEAAIAELDGNPTPEPLDADRETTARSFVRTMFNIDPDSSWVQCMVAQTQRDDVLDTTLQTPSVAAGIVDDAQMRALTVAMNGCIDTISLADWATQAIGPQGDVRDTAPPCFADRFDDTESGDVLFYNFVALTYEFRLEPSGIDRLIDTLSTCAPITSLTDFFAGSAEVAAGFETVVDRECLNDALSPAEVSSSFWEVFVNRTLPAVEFITPYADGCASTPNSDLAAAVPDDFEPWTGTGALAAVAPPARVSVYDAAPPMTVDPAASYEAVIATGGGEIRVRLLVDTAPLTVNNFVSLARDGYYDGTVFHRVLDGFMAQGGDPTGTGTGGPGYQFADEFDGGPRIDRAGLLAMANAGPNTNGSQFFITFEEADYLTGDHTVFGEVIEGMEVVNAIERRDPDAPAGRGQVIESVTIIES